MQYEQLRAHLQAGTAHRLGLDGETQPAPVEEELRNASGLGHASGIADRQHWRVLQSSDGPRHVIGRARHIQDPTGGRRPRDLGERHDPVAVDVTALGQRRHGITDSGVPDHADDEWLRAWQDDGPLGELDEL
jgi:hypothetical protein